MNRYNRVQNTYISIFQVLGGLGLLLGSLGLGVVVLRNVLERRSELAVLRVIGFPRNMIVGMVLSEHGWLLIAGLGCGVVAALVAVFPRLVAPGAEIPWLPLSATLAGVFGGGLLWTLLATFWALRTNLISALRND